MSFLKKILEPSEQDAFDHLTWTGNSCISIFEGLCPGDVLPSANMGLPSPLVPRQPPQPAYVTHTGPLVQMLLQQDQLGTARSGWPAEPQHHGDPRDAGAQEQTPVRGRRGSAAGTEKDSMRIPKEKSSWTPPGVCHRIVFARKPSLTVPPQSSLACSSKRE